MRPNSGDILIVTLLVTNMIETVLPSRFISLEICQSHRVRENRKSSLFHHVRLSISP